MVQRIASREEWLDARKALLEKEKAFDKERDALSAARRDLPMVRVDKDYIFKTNDGDKSLYELFGYNTQLIVYHFMFGKDWEEGCPSCSYLADNFNGIDMHLNARDVSLVAISNAPLEKLNDYKERLGWSFNWASADGNSFGEDFGVTFPNGEVKDGNGYNYTDQTFNEEMPGASVFVKLNDGTVAHTYSTYGRGLDMLIGSYHFIDITPAGRDEGDLSYPMEWIRRNDSYDDY